MTKACEGLRIPFCTCASCRDWCAFHRTKSVPVLFYAGGRSPQYLQASTFHSRSPKPSMQHLVEYIIPAALRRFVGETQNPLAAHRRTVDVQTVFSAADKKVVCKI